MSQWGRNDQSVTVTTSTTHETSNGAPIGTYALVKAGGGDYAHQGNTHGTRANADKTLFGNTTVGAFIPGVAKGIFGVDKTEVNVDGGPIIDGAVTFAGSGYSSNATVTLTITQGGSSGVVNAHATNGRIDAIKIQTRGSGYVTPPTISIAAPGLIIFNGNTDVNDTDHTISIPSANSKFLVGDKVVWAGNSVSVPGGLTDQGTYYISFSNSSVLALSATNGGANIAITKASGTGGDSTGSANGATLQGETATGKVTVGGSIGHGIAHAGWVLRTEGTGGRAGRVQYETLVAMKSLGAQSAAYGTPASVADASDDIVLPDA
jgi:hypothetical protein